MFKQSLTDKANDRKLFMKGIDVSYYYEFKIDELKNILFFVIINIIKTRILFMKNFTKLTIFFVMLVVLLHIGFVVLEMFFWNHPIGQKIFNMTPEVSASSAPLAMQQGLYNGFLVSGLIWGLIKAKRDILVFFLLCIILAGVFGGLSVKLSIIFTQALPAVVAMLFIMRDKNYKV